MHTCCELQTQVPSIIINMSYDGDKEEDITTADPSVVLAVQEQPNFDEGRALAEDPHRYVMPCACPLTVVVFACDMYN